MRRVVITGMGVLSPLGNSTAAHFARLLEGASGIGPITAYDTTGYPIALGGELHDFAPAEHLGAAASRLGRTAQMALAASRMALADSGVDLDRTDRSRAGVCLGTTSGEQLLLEELIAAHLSGGDAAVPRHLVPQYPSGMIAANVASWFGLEGTVAVIPTACAASNYALGYAYDLIRKGALDLALAGGAESFARVPVCGFSRLFSIDPEACRPFDRGRKGIVPSEAAAVLVLEAEEGARRRGAHVHAEILGYGLACAAYQMTKPEPDGDSGYRCMRQALSRAGVDEAEVDYISAHGTGTPANDVAETIAIKRAFGGRAHRIPVSSIKSAIGHSFGAAGAVEAATCAMVIEKGAIPPTINYRERDPDCDLDYVPNVARETQVEVALSNAMGLGGHNGCVLLGRAT